MSSSDTDEEDQTQFLEAIDHEFLVIISKKAEEKKNNPSLRPRIFKTVTNELKVTPAFQEYVGKHLDEIIKRQIKEVPFNDSAHTYKISKLDGIRMFSNSKKLIRSRDLEPELNFRNSVRRKQKQQLCHQEKFSSSDESADERERLREAAVSPEWVLGKEGVYGKCHEKNKLLRLVHIGDGIFLERAQDSN